MDKAETQSKMSHNGARQILNFLGVESLSEAAQLVNRTSLSETNPRGYQMLVDYLKGRRQAEIANDFNRTSVTIAKGIKSALEQVKNEIQLQKRPNHLFLSLSTEARESLLAWGLTMDQDLRDHVRENGAAHLFRARNMNRKSYNEICEAFGLDSSIDGQDKRKPLSGSEKWLLGALAGTLDQIFKRDRPFDIDLLRTTITTSRFPVPVSAAQICLLNGKSYSNASLHMEWNSEGPRKKMNRHGLKPLKEISFGFDKEKLYALSKNGEWIRDLFDAIIPEDRRVTAESAIAALGFLECHVDDRYFVKTYFLLRIGLGETQGREGSLETHIEEFDGFETSLDSLKAEGLIEGWSGNLSDISRTSLTAKGEAVLSEAADILVSEPDFRLEFPIEKLISLRIEEPDQRSCSVISDRIQ